MTKCSNPSCGKELSDGAVFCDVCGTRVVSAATAQSPTPHSPTPQSPTPHSPTPHPPTPHPPTPQPPTQYPPPTTSNAVPDNYVTWSVVLAIAGPFVAWYISEYFGFAFSLVGIIIGYKYKNSTAKIAGIISTVITILLWLSVYG